MEPILITFLFGLLLILIVFIQSRLSAGKNQPKLTINDPATYKLAVENSETHIIITDPNGRIIYANAAAEKITGYSQKEIIGATPKLWGGLMSQEFYKQMWHTIKDEKKPFQGMISNKKKNGQAYTAKSSISPILVDRDVIGFIGIEEDISEQLATQAKLNLEKIRDEAIMMNLAEGLMVLDKAHKIQMINPAFERISGYSQTDLFGKDVITMIPLVNKQGQKLKEPERPIIKALTTKSTQITHEILTIVNKNGKSVPVSIAVAPLIMNGETIGAVQLVRDMTEEQAIDQAKTEFVSLASHQLRTPITTIRWYSEILQDQKLGELSQKQKSYLSQINRASINMAGLVSSLLNVSRIELGSFAISPQKITVNKEIEKVLKDLGSLIQGQQIDINIQVEPDSLEYTADPLLFDIILTNLLSNALKYSPKNTKINLVIRPNSDQLLISVEDKGCGIPTGLEAKIFTKLYRADNVKKQVPDGSGLGLYITKSIVDHCHGRIWYKSIENKGTTFSVELPLTGMKEKVGNKPLQEPKLSNLNKEENAK